MALSPQPQTPSYNMTKKPTKSVTVVNAKLTHLPSSGKWDVLVEIFEKNRGTNLLHGTTKNADAVAASDMITISKEVLLQFEYDLEKCDLKPIGFIERFTDSEVCSICEIANRRFTTDGRGATINRRTKKSGAQDLRAFVTRAYTAFTGVSQSDAIGSKEISAYLRTVDQTVREFIKSKNLTQYVNQED
jgi:hypothetical protein